MQWHKLWHNPPRKDWLSHHTLIYSLLCSTKAAVSCVPLPLTFMAALFSFLLARSASLSDLSCRYCSYSWATRAGSALLLRKRQFSVIIWTLSRMNLKSRGTL